MKIKNLQMKKAFRTVLFVLLLCAAGMTKAQTENITFADANVKAICVANWDTDGDGELNQAEAAAVTSLDGVFMFDDGITSFDELQFFTGLTSIGEDEFNSCTSLTAVSIPNEVTSIGNYAFSDCSSLTSLTSYACTSPTMGNNVFDNVPSAMVINVPCHTSAMYQAAEGWSDFSNYVEFEYGLCPIPFVDDNVKAICVAHWDTNGDGELSYAEAAAVTNLGTYFKSTAITSFDELEYFTSLTSIPNTAFYGCTSLASITLPSSVSTLGNGSFYNCTNLATMTVYAETPPTVGTNAFKNVPTDIVVYLPCGTYDAYHNANGWSQFANMQEPGSCPIVFADANVKALCVANWDTNGDGELSYDEAAVVTDLGIVFRNKSNIIVFDELQYFTGLTSIGNKAFQNCGGLTSIEIPNSVTFIGDFAFDFCTSLTSIEIPNSVTLIGNYAFYYCANLISIEIPNSVTSIGDGTFSSCSGLTSIEIPNSVTFIGDYAFQSCTGLSSIEIPSSVTSIGTNPFLSCSGLEQVVVDSGNEVYDSRDNCNAIIETSINVLVAGCKNTIIPNSVMSIGNSAFQDCVGLTSIEIPNSMSFIGSNAFYGCCSLVSITVMADNPPDLGNNVFYGVNTDILVYVPCASLLAYQNVLVWNAFTNYVPATTCASGEIIVMVNPYEGGLVTGTGYYEGGATCTLTAIANTGYSFINWSKDDVEVSNSEIYSFVVAGDASFVANFIAMPPLPVVAEYYPDPNETNSPYVKVHWAASSFEAQIGEGTSTFGYFPFYTLYNYSISENLFLASELEEAGVNTAPMTSLSWYATNAPGYEQQGISIWMANVSDTELTTTSHTVNEMTLVYTGTMTPEIGWNEFVFNEGNFVWDGTSNVLVFCQRNNGEWNSTVWWQSNEVDFNASSYHCQDSGPYNVTVANTMSTSTKRPNIIMKCEGQMIYNLYRANCDGTDAQLIAENLNDTQYIDETWWQLENNSYKYGVSIADSTSTDIFWSNCIENNFIPTAFHFITAGNWSDAANWQYGALPGAYGIVFIDADCQLDMTTEVSELNVSNGQSLTLQPDKTLTVTGDLTNTSTEGLVIKDGAQLINASGNVVATMEKDIVAYSDSNPDAWYTIASPMNEMPIEGSNFATPEFDLYRYNESNLTNEEWENYKGGLADFTTFENGRGYLFANSNAFSPAFTGTLNSSAVTCPLSYTERPNDPLSGFHLIGNPFSHDIYKGAGAAIDDANLASGYYTLTNEGTWQVHTFEDAIHPGQGILVKATAPTILTIAKSTAVATSETGGAKRETSPLSISVKGENGMDQAFVYFGRGNSMEKMGGFVAQEPSLWARDNGKDYAIAHVEKACESLELCFSSKLSGDFTLTIDRNETEFEYLQLVDHISGLTVDLLKQPAYVFQAAGQEPEARFSIRFKVAE